MNPFPDPMTLVNNIISILTEETDVPKRKPQEGPIMSTIEEKLVAIRDKYGVLQKRAEEADKEITAVQNFLTDTVRLRVPVWIPLWDEHTDAGYAEIQDPTTRADHKVWKICLTMGQEGAATPILLCAPRHRIKFAQDGLERLLDEVLSRVDQELDFAEVK